MSSPTIPESLIRIDPISYIYIYQVLHFEGKKGRKKKREGDGGEERGNERRKGEIRKCSVQESNHRPVLERPLF